LYRKFTATQIFNGFKMLPPKTVLITNAKGQIIDIVDSSMAGDDIKFVEGILCPGFVNSHCHLELSQLKNLIPTGTGLVQFVQGVINKRTHFAIEEKQQAMQMAIAEMEKTGIVAVGDICNTTDSVDVKKGSNIVWHNFIELSGFVPSLAQKRFDDGLAVYNAFNKNNTSICAHAPYSVSDELFSLINKATAHQTTTIHNQESTAELDFFKEGKGDFLTLYKNLGIDISFFSAPKISSLRHYLPKYNQQQQLILVHNTFTTKLDIDIAQQQVTANMLSNLFYCLCCNANVYIEQQMPPVELLMKNDCQIVLGTDSLASNHSLSIADEINTLLAKTNIALPLLLRWATINGAKALELEKDFGSFDVGKSPGILALAVKNNQIKSVERLL
jgi:aminodeoxyfutalosine deaminase